MKKEKIVYRIIDKSNNKHKGVYSRACHDVYDFESVEAARSSNCWDIFQNKETYKIAKYKITYTLIDENFD